MKKTNWERFKEGYMLLPFEQRQALERFVRDCMPKKNVKSPRIRSTEMDAECKYLVDLIHEKGESYRSLKRKIEKEKGVSSSEETISKTIRRCARGGQVVEDILSVTEIDEKYWKTGIVRDNVESVDYAPIVDVKRNSTVYLLGNGAQLEWCFRYLPSRVQSALIRYVQSLILLDLEEKK